MVRMRIACPTCPATYDVPDRLLAGTGRRLRCSRCGTEFPLPAAAPVPERPPPEEAVPVATAPPPPEPAPPPRILPEPRERPPVAASGDSAPAALQRAWVASLVLVLGAVVALVLLRERVMEAWPPAARLFTALGLA